MAGRAFLLNHMREALVRAIQNGSEPEVIQLRLEGLVLEPTRSQAIWELFGEHNTRLASMSYVFRVEGREMDEITSRVRAMAGSVRIVHERRQRARLLNWENFRNEVQREAERWKKEKEKRYDGDCKICGRPNGPNRGTWYHWCTVEGEYMCVNCKPRRRWVSVRTQRNKNNGKTKFQMCKQCNKEVFCYHWKPKVVKDLPNRSGPHRRYLCEGCLTWGDCCGIFYQPIIFNHALRIVGAEGIRWTATANGIKCTFNWQGHSHTAHITPHVRLYDGSEKELKKLLEFYKVFDKTPGKASAYVGTVTGDGSSMKKRQSDLKECTTTLLGQPIKLENLDLKQILSLLDLWRQAEDLPLDDFHMRIIEMLHVSYSLENLLERLRQHENILEVEMICTGLLALYVRTSPVGYPNFSSPLECSRILLNQFDYAIISKQFPALLQLATKEGDYEMRDVLIQTMRRMHIPLSQDNDGWVEEIEERKPTKNKSVNLYISLDPANNGWETEIGEHKAQNNGEGDVEIHQTRTTRECTEGEESTMAITTGSEPLESSVVVPDDCIVQ